MTDQEPTDYSSFEINEKVKNGELTVSHKSGRSKVWLVFDEILKSNGEIVPNYVFCKYCKKAFKYTRQTSNLIRHKCYVDLHGQETASESGNSNNNSLPEILTRWLIKECQSYELLQSKGLRAAFREFARLGSKSSNDVDVVKLLPSQLEVTNSITQINKQCFERVSAEITSIKEHGFGLTSAIKTNNVTKQSIIVLTAHYIKNAALKFNFLGLRLLEGDNSTNQEGFVRKIKQILEDFDCELSNKSILVANSSYPIPDTQNLPCISQLLSNAIIESMEEVPEVLEIKYICSNLVNFLTKQGQENILVGLKQDSHQNAWMTTYNMLNCIEKNWSEIEDTLRNLKEKARTLTVNVSHLKALIKALQPFEEAIDTLENDSNGTLHYVILYLHELKKSCDTNDNEFQDYEFIGKLKEKLRMHLEKIMSKNITILHKIALFLYPPTNKLLQFSDNEKISIEDECIRLMQNYTYDNFKPKTPIDAAVSKRRKLFSDFIAPETNNYTNENLSTEIQLYKNTRVINSPDFDVFNWWKLQKETFPLLYKLSCTVLATPATCAASKRILFKGKSLQMTNEAEFEKLMFVNSNAESDELESYFSTVEHD